MWEICAKDGRIMGYVTWIRQPVSRKCGEAVYRGRWREWFFQYALAEKPNRDSADSVLETSIGVNKKSWRNWKESGGQSPIPKIQAITDIETGVQAVEYFIRTGELYPGISWLHEFQWFQFMRLHIECGIFFMFHIPKRGKFPFKQFGFAEWSLLPGKNKHTVL